jgi:Tol biopolymer transport system component
MALNPGTRLGPYELLAPIGSGAMGDVYRARDTRLNRDVAIKVLPAVFARDPDRLARFEREARAVAAINHPNILSVHDIGSADVVDDERNTVRATYMITELLDGDTLRARLAQGPLPARKAVDVAIQVARGLSAAHDRGIVHRDLKPENIVLLRDGHVKILDFGLAKQSFDPVRSGDQQTMAATDAGTVMGTVGYMAPEQVRGDSADSRTDLFALGVVLYELASGRRAFERPTAAETMTAILREDPQDLTSPPAALSPALDRVVRHALEKDANDRFQSARDFAFALQALNDSVSSSAATAALGAGVRRPIRARELVAWILAGALAVAAAAILLWRPAPRAAAASPIIFTASPPWSDAVLASPSVSPDGARIAFILHRRAGDSIVVRRLDAIQPQPLKGTAGVRSGGIFWSPNGQALGFFAGGKLKTIELATEKLEEIADAPSGYGGTWGPDGTILYSPDERTPIYRVSAKGGDAKPVTTLDPARHDQAHRWPQFLPDGRHFVFMPWAGTVTRKIQLAALDGTPSRTLFESESAAIAAGNYLLYVRDLPSRLLAQAFNSDTLQLEGRPTAVVADDNVAYDWATGEPDASASAGTLVYTTGKFRDSQLTWRSRTGRALGTVGDPGVYYDPVLSPDGTMLAVEKGDARGATDLWTIDLARGASSRLTTTLGFEDLATWSPDGRRIAFASDQGTALGIHIINANGTGADDVIVRGRAFPMDWSRDGRSLLYTTDGGATRQDILIYDVQQKTSTPFLASAFNEFRPKFSPDGKWIAYVSDESGDAQVYARSFPDSAVKIQISSAGGNQPEWRRDGKELFYLAPDSTLMAVDLRAGGAGLVVGASQPLFLTNNDDSQVLRNHYTASPDGQRFLVMSPLLAPNVSPLVGVLNWASALARKP